MEPIVLSQGPLRAASATKEHTFQEWEQIRPIFTRLYRTENKPLPEVMKILAETPHGFRASTKMFKSRITKWKLDKKNKDAEMRAVVRKGLALKAKGKEPVFLIRGHLVNLENAFHYFKRKGIPDPAQISNASAPPTPEAVRSPSPTSFALQELGSQHFLVGAEPSEDVPAGTMSLQRVSSAMLETGMSAAMISPSGPSSQSYIVNNTIFATASDASVQRFLETTSEDYVDPIMLSNFQSFQKWECFDMPTVFQSLPHSLSSPDIFRVAEDLISSSNEYGLASNPSSDFQDLGTFTECMYSMRRLLAQRRYTRAKPFYERAM